MAKTNRRYCWTLNKVSVQLLSLGRKGQIIVSRYNLSQRNHHMIIMVVNRQEKSLSTRLDEREKLVTFDR